jgi:hypothetical protein
VLDRAEVRVGDGGQRFTEQLLGLIVATLGSAHLSQRPGRRRA